MQLLKNPIARGLIKKLGFLDKAAVKQVTTRLTAMLSLLTEINATLAENNATLAEINATFGKNVVGLEENVAGLEENMDGLEEKVAGLEEKNATLKENMAGLEDVVAEKDAEIARLAGVVRGLKLKQDNERLEQNVAKCAIKITIMKCAMIMIMGVIVT